MAAFFRASSALASVAAPSSVEASPTTSWSRPRRKSARARSDADAPGPSISGDDASTSTRRDASASRASFAAANCALSVARSCVD